MAAILLSIPAFATTVRRLGLTEMVAASEVIVEGRVESVRSFWQGKQIVTEITVAVARTLKGARQDKVTFVQPGGRVEAPVPLEMTVPGAPFHRVGDEAYFFLEAGRPGERVVVGLYQGRVPLRRDGRGDYVVSAGARRSPAEFEEDVRRAMAAQRPDRSEAAQ